MPPVLLPAIGTALLLISVIPSFLDDKAVEKNQQTRLKIYLILEMILEIAFIVVLSISLGQMGFSWTKDAYASIFWILILSAVVFTGLMVLESAYILIQSFRGFYTSDRRWGIEIDGLSSYFVIANWILFYLVVYISPYLIK
jgi:cytochrome c oxidase subunit 3/cytochrome c oxidase subunit I+III